jgi:acyl carrier protein
MSDDPAGLTSAQLLELIRPLVAEVMMVPLEEVTAHAALVADLGGESIDFLDLVFRIEETLGVVIPHRRWEAYVRERFEGQDLARVITTTTMVEFAHAAIANPARG